MTGETPPDPFAFFRQMVTQWEQAANDYGTKIAGTPEFAQGMQGATAMGVQVQQATNEAMARALSAANMPSRSDIEIILVRLTAIEAQLARIEASLGSNPVETLAPVAPRPQPKRTKKPPKAA